MTANRKLAAILAADVVGFSTMMQADESGTLALLKQRRKEILEPLVAKHRGRLVKVMGDGVLIEFASAVAAVQCAVELQQAMAAENAANDAKGNNDKNVLLRIGVNLGDVLVEGGDLYGDGVNVAARLEALAEPGAICISAKVKEEVQGKLDLSMEDRGEVALKNMPRPVGVFEISPSAHRTRNENRAGEVLVLPSKPSIAVLPFDNLSDDPGQEYFADGVVEEIITALSRIRWLFVIARNSSFTYKSRATNVKQVGREPGVRYVLEGSVRQAGKKVRITGQLVDAMTGAHLWADRFDGSLEDIFDLQEQVTSKVVGAITPRLEQAEIERAKRKPTESLDAYDYYLRGMAAVHRWTREGNDEALSLFQRAIELDPEFSSAYGMAARCFSQRKVCGWFVDAKRESGEAEWYARRAAELGRDDAVALAAAGMAYGYVSGDLDRAAGLIDRAVDLNPNLAWGWLFSGWVRIWLGEPALALQHVERAIRLSPHDALLFNMHACLATAHFFAGHYAEALSWAERAMRDNPHHLMPPTTAAASNALAGRSADAEKAVSRILEIDPSMRLSNLHALAPLRRSDDLLRFTEALRKAGLPE